MGGKIDKLASSLMIFFYKPQMLIVLLGQAINLPLGVSIAKLLSYLSIKLPLTVLTGNPNCFGYYNEILLFSQGDILEYLAFTYYTQGNLRRALKYTNELLKVDPTHARAVGNKVYYEDTLKNQKDEVKRKGKTAQLTEKSCF